jgi:hypothetical protein
MSLNAESISPGPLSKLQDSSERSQMKSGFPGNVVYWCSRLRAISTDYRKA